MYKTLLQRRTVFIVAVTALVLLPWTKAFACFIELTKTCTDAVSANGPIQYSGVVRNICDTVPLTNVTVVDDNGTPGNFSDDAVGLGPIALAPAGQSGDSASYGGSYVPLTSPSTNTVVATGYVDTYEYTATASATCLIMWRRWSLHG